MSSAASKAATPVELVRQLDGWLSSSGYGAEHPWRLSIAGTLAAHEPHVGDEARRLASLFVGFACKVAEFLDTLEAAARGDEQLIWGAMAQARELGMLADMACTRLGAIPHRGGPTEWFVSQGFAEGLQALDGIGGALGGRAAKGNEHA